MQRREERLVIEGSRREDIEEGVLSKVANVAGHSAQVAAITTTLFLPLDYALFSRQRKGSTAKGILSGNSLRQIGAAAINTGLKHLPSVLKPLGTVFANNMKSSGAKVSCLNVGNEVNGKFNSHDDFNRLAEEGDEIITSSKGQFVAASFGTKALISVPLAVLETIGTQSFAVQSAQNKAKMQNSNYTTTPWAEGITGWFARTRLGFEVRATKNFFILASFPTTEALTEVYKNSGYTEIQSKWLAIGSVGCTIGAIANAFDCAFVSIAVSGKSTAKTIMSMWSKCGPRAFMGGAFISMGYTGYANTIVPMVQAFVSDSLVPAERNALAYLANQNHQMVTSQLDAEKAQAEVIFESSKKMIQFVGLLFNRPMTPGNKEELEESAKYRLSIM
jgi:hypothetical protein